jgi:hypothetical protein
MGAYENPITVVDDKSALILAQGFQSFAASLTDAYLKQQKKEKEIADQTRIDNANVVKAEVKGAEEAEKIINERKAKFGDPADVIVDFTRNDMLRERELYYALDAFAVRNDEDSAKQKEMQKEYNALKRSNANLNSDLEALDVTFKKIAEAKERGSYIEGDLDERNPANKPIFDAYNQFTREGGIKQNFTRTQNSQGENIFTFYPEEGEPFKWNITTNGAVDENKTIPNSVKKIEAAITSEDNPILQKTKAGYVPSDKYKIGSKDEAGNFMPEYTYKTEYKEGYKITYRAQKYDEEAINTAITSAAQAEAINLMDDPDAMRSVFLHNMSGIVGEKINGVTIDTNMFGNYGEEMSDDQKKLFTAALAQTMKDKYPAVPEYEEYAKVVVPKEEPKVSNITLEGIKGIVSGKRKTFTKKSTRVRTADKQPEGESGWFKLKDGIYAIVENKTTLGWSADTGVTSEEALYDAFEIIDPELIVK